MHPEVYRSNLFRGPLRHGLGHKHGAADDLVQQVTRPLDRGLHLLDSNPACSVHAASYEISRCGRIQPLCRVIRLGRPGHRTPLDELDSTAVEYVIISIHGARATRQAHPE